MRTGENMQIGRKMESNLIGWNDNPHTFPRASRQLRVFASSFEWFPGLSKSFLIGQSDYFRPSTHCAGEI